MRTALIDADVLAVQAAIVNQKATRWGDEGDEDALWTIHAHEEDGERTFANMVETISTKVGADKIILAFSDKLNWRKDVLPTYKANRAKTPQPLLRSHLVAWAQDKYECFTRATLEGDDVMGILLTRDSAAGEEIIGCSIDKDFNTIPGHHYNFGRDEFFTVTGVEADYYHLYQTLVGDAVDNYAGCPGVGPVAAKKILTAKEEDMFFSVPEMWKRVVAAFDKAGLGEEEALVQARVARICRASDYDFKTKKVKLWTPQ